MKKLVATCLVTGLACSVAFCAPAVQTQSEKGFVAVSTSAEDDFAPNLARVVLYVETSNKVLENATNENKTTSAKAIEAVKKVLDEKKGDTIKTLSFNVNPEYTYTKDNKREFSTYRVSNSFEVRTKNPKEIGKIIDTALNAGATRVDGLNYSLSDIDDACNGLIAKATKSAHARAQNAAMAMSAKLGGIKQVTTSCNANNGYSPIVPRMYMAKGAMDSAESANSNIPTESGLIKVYANVDSQFWLN